MSKISQKKGKINTLASLSGCKSEYIEAMIRDEILPAPTAAGYFDLAKSKPIVIKYKLNYYKAEKMAGEMGENYDIEHRRYAAALKKLEYEKKIGEVVSKAVLFHQGFEIGKLVKDRLLGLSHSLAPIAAAESDPTKIENLWNTEIERILNEVGDRIEGL